MRTVVVGASLAGLGVVRALREAGHRDRLTLMGDEPHPPYDRPPLSKGWLSGQNPATLELAPAGWYEEHQVELLLGAGARRLDPVRRSIETDAGQSVSYDQLVVATGARARRLPASQDCAGVHTLRTREDGERLRAGLAPGRRLLVLGAGFLGMEVAASARSAGLSVTVVDPAPAPLARALGAEVGGWFARLHQRHGVLVRCGVSLSRLERHGSGYRAGFDDGSSLDCDVVLAAVGATPNTEWLAGSGVRVEDGVLCDEAGRSSVPGVFAAGDVARWPLFDAQLRIEHWSNALDQARIVADTLLERQGAPALLPSFWSDQFEAKARFVGRPGCFDVVRMDEPADGALVATFSWQGRVVGGLCVNRPRELVQLRHQIVSATAWSQTSMR